MNKPISKHWEKLTPAQAWCLLAAGLVLELPIRWIVRPDMSDLYPGSPWFNLPLRLALEAGFILFMFAVAWLSRVSFPAIGTPFRRWTRWEWSALAIVGAIELTVVISVAGGRWPRIVSAGLLAPALMWAFGEFMFGFNQETGFRGLIMSGLLRITSPVWATILNTLLFLIGPLHGPGLLELLDRNPAGAMWLTAGVVATGLFFSWLRYRTDNVILAGVLHGIVNSFLNGAALVLRANS